MYAKYVGVSGLIVKEYRLESKILSSNFSGFKVVHFSDLLYKSTIDQDDVKKVVEKINLLKADIVIFSGDLVSKGISLSEEDISFLTDNLSNIDAKIGKYAVYGDCDYDNSNYESIMSDSDFMVLRNQYDEVYYKTHDVMYVVGLASAVKDNVKLEDAFSFYSDEERQYTIVIVHDGKTIKYLDESTYEVDLILGGHSLNGSVVIPYYGGIFKDESNYKYMKEHYSKGLTQIYMSSGLGTNEYGFRLFNKPSINLYRLKAQS